MKTLAVVTVVGVYGVCTATAPALTQLVGENRAAIDAGSAPARTINSRFVSLTPAGHGEAVGGRADAEKATASFVDANRAFDPRAQGSPAPPAPSTFIELGFGETRRALAYTEWCALNTDDRAYITRWPVN